MVGFELIWVASYIAPIGIAVGEYAIEEACAEVEGDSYMDACGADARECAGCEQARSRNRSSLTPDSEARAWEAFHILGMALATLIGGCCSAFRLAYGAFCAVRGVTGG